MVEEGGGGEVKEKEEEEEARSHSFSTRRGLNGQPPSLGR